ncbi:hypothetical protein [Planotetraspora kaengkrachanensis]|uniref:Uncharacterized protein n=1 Tax=Planotetraspora kaengkrachanensis TaxID=575193 RepID=A0A8J3LYD4_9ACTN|nr:hypothetical protein [Planotetraspora kaengkrachanensis]GIG80857.1 hypothetical protein Pka01_39840 [Planotetraspora kaengkrachanensis]
MWFNRFLAIGFLSGIAMLPVLWIQRGDEFEHIRLAALIGLDAGQFLTVPITLAVGAWKASPWNKRPRPTAPGFVLGGITFAFGALIMTQAIAAIRWLDGRPPGVGDPDGETGAALQAVPSGGVTLLAGAAILINRAIAAKRSRKVVVPVLTDR